MKHYHTELGSPKVDLILAESGSDYFIARLTLAEVTSVFAKKVRTGEIPDADFDRLRLRFFADVRNRTVTPVRILNAHFESAGDLIARHGKTRRSALWTPFSSQSLSRFSNPPPSINSSAPTKGSATSPCSKAWPSSIPNSREDCPARHQHFVRTRTTLYDRTGGTIPVEGENGSLQHLRGRGKVQVANPEPRIAHQTLLLEDSWSRQVQLTC